MCSRRRSAQERLTQTADGRVLLTLKAEWSDGTTHLRFEPIELLERLAALTPRPRINLVFAPRVLAPPFYSGAVESEEPFRHALYYWIVSF